MNMLPDRHMMKAFQERTWRKVGPPSLARYLRTECCELPKEREKRTESEDEEPTETPAFRGIASGAGA